MISFPYLISRSRKDYSSPIGSCQYSAGSLSNCADMVSCCSVCVGVSLLFDSYPACDTPRLDSIQVLRTDPKLAIESLFRTGSAIRALEAAGHSRASGNPKGARFLLPQE